MAVCSISSPRNGIAPERVIINHGGCVHHVTCQGGAVRVRVCVCKMDSIEGTSERTKRTGKNFHESLPSFVGDHLHFKIKDDLD